MMKKVLASAAVLLMAIAGTHAERMPPHAPLENVLADNKYEPSSVADVDSEFGDFDEILQAGPTTRRRLQNGNSGTTTTERCNTWCKLKESFAQTIIGLILVCLAPCLMWKNEGRHVNQLRRIDFCKNKAVVVPNAEIPTDENTGQLVHFTGKVSVDEDALELHPGPLNVTAPLPKALVVKRTCMIYQKFEQASQEVKNDTIGAGQTTTTTYTVREDWTPMGPQVERLEHLPGETNSRGVWDELVSNAGVPESAAPAPSNGLPPEIAALLQQVDNSKAPHDMAVSKAAHVGGFALSHQVITSEPAVFLSEWMPLPAELIPEEIEALPELRKDRYGNLTTVEEGEQPTNGDVMIKYEYVADSFDASFIVQQVLAESDPETGVSTQKFGVEKQHVLDKKCCWSDDLGVIWMVRRGRHDVHDMINMAQEEEKTLTKILRLVCWALLVGGWMSLFSIFTTLLSTLPILGALGNAAFFIVALIVGTVCCCGVTAIAYVRYRPLLAFGILALSGGIAGIIIWRLNDANEASAQPTPAPVKSPAFLFSDDIDASVDSMY